MHSHLCAQHRMFRALGLRCEWEKNKEEIADRSCTYNHTSNLETVLALGSGLVTLRNNPNLDEIWRKLSALQSNGEGRKHERN